MTLDDLAHALTVAIGTCDVRRIYWERRAKVLERDLAAMTKAAAGYQQQAGELAPDALRWRLHLRDCARGGKTAAQRQRVPVLAKMAEMRGEE